MATANINDKRELIFQLAQTVRRITTAKQNGYKLSSTHGRKLADDLAKHKQALSMTYPDAWRDFCKLYELDEGMCGADLFNK